MKKINVKIHFVTNSQVLKQSDVLFWNNYEEKVRADIKAGKGGSNNVYLKHLMPRSEMDRSVLEFCERINLDGHPLISFGSIARKYTFAGESIPDDMITEASYHFVV